ncbi:MAG: pilus assembly protein [Actinomycetota bacterium]|nr:pilus assembly protein [Actinomycetota bacterium]
MSRGTFGCRGCKRGDQGQAAVELALVLPFVAMLALVLVQVALVVRDQVLVSHAAREAAREAAVSEDPGLAGQAARASDALDPARLVVEVSGRGRPGSRVRVDVSYSAPTDVPLVGPMVGDVALSGAATMRVER